MREDGVKENKEESVALVEERNSEILVRTMATWLKWLWLTCW
jgi:hypothetical protein